MRLRGGCGVGVIAGLSVLGLIVGAEASAVELNFTVDPAQSMVTITNAVLERYPAGGYLTTLEPKPPDTFTRQVEGNIVFDTGTAAITSASLPILGSPLVGDQIMTRRMLPADVGDFTVTGLGLAIDAAGMVSINAGTIEFDVSFGTLRERSTSPLDLTLAPAAPVIFGGTPVVTSPGDGTLRLEVPIIVSIVDLHVIEEGQVSFDINGTLVPEPNFLLGLVSGVVALGLLRPRGRRR